MLRESLTTPKKESKGRRPLVMVLLAGACAVALGTFGFSSTTHAPISDAAMHAHLTSLIDHHQYLADQNAIIGELIEEGVENQIAVTGTIAAISAAATFAKTAGPIISGVGSMAKNIIWGGMVAKKTVDPAKIDASFDNSKTFAAEIAKRFPKSYKIVTQLRQDLKVHHFDLSNTIQDVSLLADSTKNNARRTIKKLNLRKTFIQNGVYVDHPEKDYKIWNYAIKRQVDDLQSSLEKCDKIIEILKKLQKDVAKTQDDLEKELEFIKTSLEKSTKGLEAKMRDLEQQVKSAGCVNNSAELIRAIFTLGIACAFDSPTRRKLDNVKADLLEEKTIFEALLKRMGYFDGLVGVAKEMTQQAAGLLESTKQFRAKIRDTKEELETDYEPGMVLENMGDVDFANDYAESLFESLDSLMQECDRVSADCIERKHKMDLALVGLTGDDLEVVQLSAADVKIADEFYAINDECANYFHNTSQSVADIQDGYVNSIIESMQEEKTKDMLLMISREEYGDVKDKLFDVLDTAKDIQLAVESAQHRLNLNVKKIRKYIDKKSDWKYQHKYSVRTTRACRMDKATVMELRGKLAKSFDEFNALMEKMTMATTGRLTKGIASKVHECKKLSTPIPKPEKPEPPVEEGEDGEEGEADFDPFLLENVNINGWSLPDKVDDLIPDSIYDRKYQKALAQWKIAEAERKAQLAVCHQKEGRMKQSLLSWRATVKECKAAAPTKAVTYFPKDLDDRMDAFDKEATAASKASSQMEGTEEADNQAENTRSQKMTSDFEQDAIKKGDENQVVKKKLIS